MNLLTSVKRLGSALWASSQVWLLLLALVGITFATGLAEPRTQVLNAYTTSASFDRVYVLTVIAVVLFALRSDIRVSVPVFVAAASLPALFWLKNPTWVVPFVLLFIGGVVGAFAKKHDAIRRVSGSLFLASILLMVAPTVDLLYESYGEVVNLSAISRGIALLLPGDLARGALDGHFAAAADGRNYAMTFNVDRLGNAMFVALIAAYLAIAIVKRTPVKRIVLDLVAGLAYAVLATLFVTLRTTGASEQNYYLETPTLIKLLPLILYYVFRLAFQPAPEEATPRSALRWLPGLAGAVCLAFAVAWWPNSERRTGTVVFDEFHSGWEPTDVPLTRTLYGSLSVYNYGNLYKEVQRIFPVDRARKELSEADLDKISVLVLKTPTKPYSKAFCDRIVKFVEKGGGLWLIGDHTDAFGISTNLNQIAGRFGCEFLKDAWVEPPVKRNLWAANEFSPPIVADVDNFLFYTGCDMRVPQTFRRTMIVRRQVMEGPDYGAGSFFGPLRIVAANRGGNAIAAAVGEYGRGRVALWSDSTLFSNFAMYMPGKQTIAINTIDWLHRGAGQSSLRVALWIVGLVGIVTSAILAGPTSLLLVLGIWLAYIPGVNALVRRSQHIYHIEDLRGGQEVALYIPTKTTYFPIYFSVDEAGPEFYLSSVLAAQRVGARPVVVKEVKDFKNAKTCLYVPGYDPVPEPEMRALADWVRKGGRLVLMDLLRANRGVYLSIIRALGLPESFIRMPAEYQAEEVVDTFGNPLNKHIVGEINLPGLKPLLLNKRTKRPCAGWYPLGSGWIFVSASVEMFSDGTVGDVHTVPSELQYNVLCHTFNLLDENVSVEKMLATNVSVKRAKVDQTPQVPRDSLPR